jgi:hypothetical protein
MARSSRYQDSGLAVALGIHLGVYTGVAFCFGAVLYWLMQPTVFENYGIAAYKPPPKTVVVYADSPWAPPPAPSEPPVTVAVAEPPPDVVQSTTVAMKEVKKREARTAPRRERRVRERPNPMFDYASSRSYGFRPWF